MRTWIRTAAAAAGLLLAAAPAAPQTQTPEQAAQAYFQSLRAGDIAAVAAAMHPAAMQSLKDSLMPFVAAVSGDRAGGVEGMDMSALGTMEAGALYQFALMGLFSEVDLDELKDALNVRPLGTVNAGAGLAHVVYAVNLPIRGHPVEMRQVLTLRMHEGSWKVDPGAGISTLLNGGLLPLLITAAIAEELEGDDEADEDDDGR